MAMRFAGRRPIVTLTEPIPWRPDRPRVYYTGCFRTTTTVHIMEQGSSISLCGRWHKGWDRPQNAAVDCEHCLDRFPTIAAALTAAVAAGENAELPARVTAADVDQAEPVTTAPAEPAPVLEAPAPPAERDDWAIPAGLSAKGQLAAETIRDVAKAEGLDYTGGCRVFYSPAEWVARGEQGGTLSELIVCFDGGDHRCLFADDGPDAANLNEVLDAALHRHGLWVELCTGWFAGVYR